MGSVEAQLILVLTGEARPLKADSEIPENGETSFSCYGLYLRRLIQSDSMSIVADPELSALIVSRTGGTTSFYIDNFISFHSILSITSHANNVLLWLRCNGIQQLGFSFLLLTALLGFITL